MMLSSLVASPSQIVPLLVASHISLSLLSIVNSQLLPSEYKLDDEETIQECFDASHYELVQEYVAGMYSPRPGDKRPRGSITGYDYASNPELEATKKNQYGVVGVQLSDTAVFEDPAAICRGSNEIREAFRALQYLEPVSVKSPQCINVKPQGETILLTFCLHQQYNLPLYGTISLRSILEITVQLQQMKEIPESEFIVIQMKELWRGKPLAWPYPLYYPPRRLNGLLSYWLTSRLL